MNQDIVRQLNHAKFVRSKISYFPISHSILPVKEGMVAVIFSNDEDIKEYFELRGIDDTENFETLPVRSIYDFMRETAGIGFSGIWYFNNFPILFGNYISDIDIDLPSFAYTFGGDFIGATGTIENPYDFSPWNNYSKTDHVLRHYVQPYLGVPFDAKEPIYTIVPNQGDVGSSMDPANLNLIAFPHGSPLQGSYVSDLGAYFYFVIFS